MHYHALSWTSRIENYEWCGCYGDKQRNTQTFPDCNFMDCANVTIKQVAFCEIIAYTCATDPFDSDGAGLEHPPKGRKISFKLPKQPLDSHEQSHLDNPHQKLKKTRVFYLKTVYSTSTSFCLLSAGIEQKQAKP